MNIIKAIAAIMLTVIPAAAIAEQPAVPRLTLDECLTIAMSKSPTVRVADMEVERVDYSRKEVIGQLLPSVDFGANYNRMLAKQVMYMNMDAFAGMGGGGGEGEESTAAAASSAKRDNGIKVGLDNSWSMGFQAAVPLIAPQLWKSLSISESQILRSVETAQKSRQELVNQVKSAYYGFMLAQDSRRVIQESYDMAALTHDTYVKRYELGAASDYDVLRTSVAMKNIEPEIIQADIAIKQARLQLQVLMGVDASFVFEPSGRLADHESDMYANALALDTNIAGNADLKIFDIDTKTAEQNLALQKLAYAPTLALTANYNWTTMNNGNPFKDLRWNPYSTVGVSLSVPIFSGMQRWNKVRQARVQLEELRLQRENLVRSLDMQVSLAVDNIKMNVRQIASSSESVAQAERAHNIMEQSFGIGAASYLDLRDSELSLTRARLAYYQSIYNYLIANSSLELLLGNAPIEKYTE